MIAADSAFVVQEKNTQDRLASDSLFSQVDNHIHTYCLFFVLHLKSGRCLADSDHLPAAREIVLFILLVTILIRQLGAWESPSLVKVGK